MGRDELKGVVGIGASAGGLEALTELVESIPERSGLCFVIVQHLSPDHPSIMDELLASHTALPVRKIEDGMEVRPDTIFVIPSGPALEVASGHFKLMPRDERKGIRTPIDVFLASLAEDYGELASCVILSGTGTDGTLGLKAIKAAGGIAVVQESTSARFSGMPDSAAATGIVDARLNPGDVPFNLISIINHRDEIRNSERTDSIFESIGGRLSEIIDLLASEDDQDFSNYKTGTLIRRIERRMMLQMKTSIDEYVDMLRGDQHERARLLQDFLIGVTRFFRDPNTFEELTELVIQPLIARGQDKFRAWVPGCSTGEEAYSIGILFAEALRKTDDRRELQIFGTDIDMNSLRHARSAMYSDAALERIPKELIERYFTTVQGTHQVNFQLRERIAFAPHNLLRDPPFSRIDFISCRNLLIYLNAEGQKTVLPRFHYALKRSGFLLLGPSESVEDKGSYFNPVSRDHRIYRRNDSVAVGFSALTSRRTPREMMPQRHIDRAEIADYGRSQPSQEYEARIDQYFLTRHSAPFFVLSENDEVTYLSGTLGEYLRPAKGAPSARIEDLLAPELRAVVRPLVNAVRDEKTQASDVVSIVDGEAPDLFNVVVERLPFSEGDVIVVMQPVELVDGSEDLNGVSANQGSIEAAEQELSMVRRRLSTAEAGHAVAEQELRSANEELLSMNEELQSSNEELETSREELQSINEELETINAELSENNRQLNEVNSDLKNVLDSTDIAKLILAKDLIVRRFTRSAKSILRVDDRDLGRRVTDLKWLVAYPELTEDVQKVEASLQVVSREVSNAETGECFEVRVRPYRSVDDKLDGCIITFVDITRRKNAEKELRENREQLAAALEAGDLGVHVYRPQSETLIWDDRMREIWSVPDSREIDYEVFMNGIHPDDRQATQTKVDAALDPVGDGEYLAEYRVLQPDGPPKWVRADGKVTFENGEAVKLVGTVKDITRRHEAELRIKEYAARLELTYEATGIAAWEWKVAQDKSSWTDNMFDLLKCPKDRQPSLATFAEFISDDDRDRVMAEVDESLTTGAMLDTSFTIHRGDGEERVLAAKGRAIFDGAGEPKTMVGINYDITEDVEKEEQRRLLTSELNHRVKNSLAVIQSIASQTIRHSADMRSFRDSFLGRLRAISRAHDLLVNIDTGEASIRELIRAQVSPYVGDKEDGLVLEGPRIVLGASVAHSLGLVLHELATNASKHGALSTESGRIDIQWAAITIAGGSGFRLLWRERGGPPAKPPERSGFGSYLIEQSLEHSIGGISKINYGDDGIEVEIECPARRGGD